MLIRKDDRGLYIQSRWGAGDTNGHYRPGNLIGYAPIYRMDDGGLKEGDNPKTAHVDGTPLVKITLPDGVVLYWGTTYELDSVANKHAPPSTPTCRALSQPEMQRLRADPAFGRALRQKGEPVIITDLSAIEARVMAHTVRQRIPVKPAPVMIDKQAVLDEIEKEIEQARKLGPHHVPILMAVRNTIKAMQPVAQKE